MEREEMKLNIGIFGNIKNTLSDKSISEIIDYANKCLDYENKIKLIDILKEKDINVRICLKCHKIMTGGYCIEDGNAYYCSDECLYSNMSKEEYAELYDDGNGSSYWTEWN